MSRLVNVVVSDPWLKNEFIWFERRTMLRKFQSEYIECVWDQCGKVVVGDVPRVFARIYCWRRPDEAMWYSEHDTFRQGRWDDPVPVIAKGASTSFISNYEDWTSSNPILNDHQEDDNIFMFGMEPVKVSLNFIDSYGRERDGVTGVHRVYLYDPNTKIASPEMTGDGCKEIEMGEFINNQDDDGEVEMILAQIYWRKFYRGSLIIQGIELRPKERNEEVSTNSEEAEAVVVEMDDSSI
ncbi:hypothetical protein GIB67_021489 [Kingdonia uniflora]|uniref:Uncharacterized protein n=1 Tax=Kingdonia uniflora TaxID=39325 RepID=A0A7J7L9P0_9MAGN|nr:hypothetical protein GIB67_021489 [Kingdonia uniflora]